MDRQVNEFEASWSPNGSTLEAAAQRRSENANQLVVDKSPTHAVLNAF